MRSLLTNIYINIKQLLLISFMALLFCSSCGKRPKTIPVQEFKEIFIKASIADSYLNLNTGIYKRDTLRFFEPILNSYGYTIEDLEYTIQKHALRKSDVISVIMDMASQDISAMMDKYNEAAESNLNWMKLAKSSLRDTILIVDSVRIKTFKDIDSAVYSLKNLVDGEYVIKYKYYIDSLDKNISHNMIITMLDTATNASMGTMKNSLWLNKYGDINKKREAKVTRIIKNNNYNRMDIKLINIGSDKSKFKTPHVYIDSVLVIYEPPADYAKRKLLRNKLYGNNSIINKYLKIDEKDSVALLNKFRPFAK